VWEYLEPEALHTIIIRSNEHNNSTDGSDGEYDSEHDYDVNLCIGDIVDTPDSVDLDGDGDMEINSHDDDEENAEVQDVEQEDENEEENEDKEEDENEDDHNKPLTFIQGEMIHTSANTVDTLLDNQPIVLPEQVQEIWEHTPSAQPPVTALWLQTPEPRKRP
jgi:hypothetical protein